MGGGIQLQGSNSMISQDDQCTCAIFDAIDLTGATSSASSQADQVDPIMSYPFELNNAERADAVQSTTFIVPNW